MAEILTRTYKYTTNTGMTPGTCSLALSSFTVSGDTRPITQILSITVKYRRYHDTSATVGHSAQLVFANGSPAITSAKVSKRGDGDYFAITNVFSQMPAAADFTASNVTIRTFPDSKASSVYWYCNANSPIEIIITYTSSEFKPSLSGIRLYRANELGAAKNNGQYITFQAKAAVESIGTGGSGVVKVYAVDENTKLVSGGTLVFSKNISGSTGGVTVTAAPIPGYTLAIGSAQYFRVVFEYTAKTGSGVTSTETIESAALYAGRVFTNFHLAELLTGGACFGGFSTSAQDDPKLESHFPAYFYAGIVGVSNYSADEVATGGTWIDGKAIYRRTMTVSAAANTDANSGVIASSIGAVIGVEGSFRRTSDGKWFPASFWYSDTAHVSCQITADRKLQVRAAWAGTAYITVTYTK